MVLVDNKVKFVSGPVRRSTPGLDLAKRTPMGFAALKTKPSAVLRHRTAANCSVIRRASGTRIAVGAEIGEAVRDTACAETRVGVDCGLRCLLPLPMRRD